MKRNKFSLSNFKLLTCNMGELIPCGILEALPGDTIQLSSNVLLRASPLLSPVMHPVDVRVHHWFVPNRLVWEDFENFITGGPDGLNASVFPTITIGAGGASVGSLADYMGVPTGVASLAVSALPFRAYNMVWNEWYRDQDLQTALVMSRASGADITTAGVNPAGGVQAYTVGNTVASNCAWEKDYFTSSRPWEQKGPAITVPLGTTAPITGIGVSASGGVATVPSSLMRETSGAVPAAGYPFAATLWSTGATGLTVKMDSGISGSQKPQIFADLANASAVTVTKLREALALQRFEEARARFGSRYVEYLRYLGVKSSDGRLDKPEYLGGGRETIQWSEVLTTGVNGTDPVGSMKGHGMAAMRSNRFRRYFEEHGYVLSFMSVRPKTIYASGLPRHFNRRLKEDFYQPELHAIGQQAVKNKEVYAAHASPDGTFGFQDRYDEYRRTESTIAGEYRTTLNFWHFARIFGSSPALNATFVSCVPTEVPFAVNTTHVLWCMVKHSVQARRIVAQTGKSFIF
nr:MAG TPA: Capsid protein [Microviridae sp.]